MDKIQLLERHYNSCISQEQPLNFFMAMADYIDLADQIPEFDLILQDILTERSQKRKQLKTLEEGLIYKLDEIKEKIEGYILEKKIVDGEVVEGLNDYQAHKNKDIVSSLPLPLELHESIEDALAALYKLPQHKAFCDQFVKLVQVEDKLQVSHLKPFKEYIEYYNFYRELKSEEDMVLSGQTEQIFRLYQVIKEGRKTHRELVQVHSDSKNTVNFWNIMNYSVLFGEWKSLEEKGYRGLTFFDIHKIKPWFSRLHNHIVSQMFFLPSAVSTEAIISDTKLKFYPNDGIAEYRGVTNTFSVGKKGYELLKFLYNSKNSPLEIKYFQAGCNNSIKVEKHRFKTEKDISDTIIQIKRKLKVKNSEYFPIFRKGSCFIWEEK